eukprot:scaffold6279_cov418-Prasinococcus_capsulatus_cf.AAC.1
MPPAPGSFGKVLPVALACNGVKRRVYVGAGRLSLPPSLAPSSRMRRTPSEDERAWPSHTGQPAVRHSGRRMPIHARILSIHRPASGGGRRRAALPCDA